MRGAKPKPVEQRRLEGGSEVSHRRSPEVMLIAGRPDERQLAEPPAYLPVEAREFWRDTVARLVEVGMLDLVDEAALQMLATQYARWREAGREIEESGLIAIGSHDQPMTHPAVRVERDAHVLYLRTAEQFGLTPMARTRLGLAELHRRSLHSEMSQALGEAVDVEAVADGDDVALPGA